jgi:hypothetical protein
MGSMERGIRKNLYAKGQMSSPLSVPPGFHQERADGYGTDGDDPDWGTRRHVRLPV